MLRIQAPGPALDVIGAVAEHGTLDYRQGWEPQYSSLSPEISTNTLRETRKLETWGESSAVILGV